MVKTGAPIPVEVTPEIIALGRFAVDEYNKKECTRLEFKNVLSAERQLVDGFNYFLTLEAANEGKDINTYEATVYVSWENNAKLTEFNIFKGRPGGAYPIEVTPKVNDLGRFAVHEHNKKERTLLAFKKVLSAERQLVKGYNYYLTLEAANESEKVHLYEATVFVSGEKELTEFKLLKPTPGGAYPIEVTPKVNDLGRFAVHEHNKKECTNLKFKKVWGALEQEVEGFNYYLALEAADGGENNVYEAKVYESLKNVKELLEFKLVAPA
ncbi:UNVERIFIED_CONTAM: Multicystatin [Sesamum radiatum]|uniref:Cysteine proteinase inhibitor n=1 Tax=Sesamum radiatum TaxID=300843 RepID=A0AAW2W5J4_SESRA